MKKFCFFAFTLLTVTCYLLPAQTGVIRNLEGTVEILNPGASSFVPASTGALLNADAVISTGFRSSALIELGSAFIAVRPLSRLSLQELSSTGGVENLNLNLQAGRVRVDFNPPPGARSSMTVTTPSTTAAVRGTSFEMDTRMLTVSEGRVSYRGSIGNYVNVYEGSDSTVLADGSSSNPHGNRRTGFQPSAPVGHDTASVPSIQASPIDPFVPSPTPPGPPPVPPTPPSPPSGGSSGGGGGTDLIVQPEF
ncbi:MAG: FecR family protein [Treponema sp.]|nr:FecR family protein [Treponema sp.]